MSLASAERPGEGAFAFGPSFLRRLRTRHWGRAPGVFRGAFPSVDAMASLVFDSLVEDSDRLRAGDIGTMLSLYTERRAANGELYAARVMRPHNHLPTSKDGGLEGFAARMARRFPGSRFGLQHNEAQRHWPLWRRAAPLAAAVFHAPKMKVHVADLVAFVGTYRTTPNGIHRDTQHVITLVLRGRKRILVWPFEVFGDRPEAPSTEIALRSRGELREAHRRAIVLEGGPGDVLYWPPSYWHCALSRTDRLNVTLTLGFDERGTSLIPASPLLPSDVAAPRDLAMPNGACRVPTRLTAALRRRGAREFVTEQTAAAHERWLALVTAGGFHPGPVPGPVVNVADDASIQGDTAQKVLWHRPVPNQLIVAAAGSTSRFEVSSTIRRRLVRMLEELFSGGPTTPRALLDRFFSDVPSPVQAAARALLIKLVQWRAVRCV